MDRRGLKPTHLAMTIPHLTWNAAQIFNLPDRRNAFGGPQPMATRFEAGCVADCKSADTAV
jgi:hypothetical protein